MSQLCPLGNGFFTDCVGTIIEILSRPFTYCVGTIIQILSRYYAYHRSPNRYVVELNIDHVPISLLENIHLTCSKGRSRIEASTKNYFHPKKFISFSLVQSRAVLSRFTDYCYYLDEEKDWSRCELDQFTCARERERERERETMGTVNNCRKDYRISVRLRQRTLP